jgi:MFS family permease
VIGLAAAIILSLLRMIQGLCLGGQYGGAMICVAEHVEDKHRGYYPGWLQTSPTLGIVLSLLVIIATRTYFRTDAFNAWAWRIPLLFSFLLVFVCRLRSSSSLPADPDYRNSTHPLRICGRNFGGRFSLPRRDEPPRRATFPHHAQTRGR